MKITFQSFAILALSLFHMASAISLDVTDTTSIQTAASALAHNLMSYYTGNVTNTPETLAVLPAPYYWWEAGAMWGAMLDYYHYTGDPTYNKVTEQALVSQIGPAYDFIVPRHAYDEGNDDQLFWGFAIMAAAERNFPLDTSTTGGRSWLQLTQNMWNNVASRWNTTYCGGGLKWQIYPANKGYNYKNSISNGAFFQISARLARVTGNQTYLVWADKIYDWTLGIGLIDSRFNVFDGASETANCAPPETAIDHNTWTYNTAVFLYGAAIMYNVTEMPIWQDRVNGILKASAKFFGPDAHSPNIMFEEVCELKGNCNTDQFSFKGYLSRFMYSTTVVAPFTTNTVMKYLQVSAKAAAKICTGGTDGTTCGQKWYASSFDGSFGVGQQMSALETIQGLLVGNEKSGAQESPPTTPPSSSSHHPSSSSGSSHHPSSSSCPPSQSSNHSHHSHHSHHRTHPPQAPSAPPTAMPETRAPIPSPPVTQPKPIQVSHTVEPYNSSTSLLTSSHPTDKVITVTSLDFTTICTNTSSGYPLGLASLRSVLPTMRENSTAWVQGATTTKSSSALPTAIMVDTSALPSHNSTSSPTTPSASTSTVQSTSGTERVTASLLLFAVAGVFLGVIFV